VTSLCGPICSFLSLSHAVTRWRSKREITVFCRNRLFIIVPSTTAPEWQAEGTWHLTTTTTTKKQNVTERVESTCER